MQTLAPAADEITTAMGAIVITTPVIPTPDIYFSSDTEVEAPQHQVLLAIANARSTIDISMYTFTSKPIFNALKVAISRDVNVRMILDRGQYESTKPQNLLQFNQLQAEVSDLEMSIFCGVSDLSIISARALHPSR
jgi:hypothetical protein